MPDLTENDRKPRARPGPDAITEEVAEAPPVRRRRVESHRAVLDAAQALLREVGYSKVTIDQICARAGVSKATVYRWWPNKAAVFMELYLELSKSEARLPADTGSLEGDLREQVRRAFRLFRKTVAGQALAGFVADAQSHPQTARMLHGSFADDRRALNLGMLERARVRGELSPDIALEVAAEIITGAVYYQVLVRHRQVSDADADQIVDAILNGFKAR